MSREYSHLFAILVPGPSLELHKFVVERFMEFGVSSGLVLWWRPIASPTLADPYYKAIRSPELVRRDAADTCKYQSDCRRVGGEDLYLREQYHLLADKYQISLADRPAIIFQAQPQCKHVAKFLLPPLAFENSERRRLLSCFLYEELGSDRIQQFSEDEVFTDNSMAQLQSHLDRVSKEINRSVARGEKVSDRGWKTCLQLAGLNDHSEPSESTTADAWRKQGNLYLRTMSNGEVDGEVVFPLDDDGFATLQMRLMWRLLLAWPEAVTYRDLAEELYKSELETALRIKDKEGLETVAKRIRSLVHDIREKKLERAGINPEILPTLRKSNTRSNATLRLQLANLDRRRLGHLPRPRT